jgi:hypothetical protein
MADREGGVMGYQKFSERTRERSITLGGLGGLGGQHPQISRGDSPQILTPAPPKVAKAAKVWPPFTVAETQKSRWHPAKVAKAPKVSDWPEPCELVCVQCGGGLSTNPATDAPSIMIYDGEQETWLHPECRRFWFADHPRED